jgi:hypothetical protein
MTTDGIEVDSEGSSSPPVTTPTRLATVPEEESEPEEGLSPNDAKNNFSADHPVTKGPPMLPGLNATAGPAAGSSLDQEIRSPVERSFSTEYYDAPRGCKTPPKTPVKDRSFSTNTSSGRTVLYAPGSFAHHCRESSRLSSLPNMLSPLGPGYFVGDLGSDNSGLVSPLPSPEQTRHSEKKATPSPQKLDLHVLKVAANKVGSPYLRKSFGHDRKITDPFVDGSEKREKSGTPSPFVEQAKQNSGPGASPQIQVPGTPTNFQFPGSPVSQSGMNGAMNGTGTPTYEGFAQSSGLPDFHVPGTPVFAPFPPETLADPSVLTFFGTVPRADLPIPPPLLSNVQGQLQHSPETRARLDARAATRAEWITTEAAKIASLARETHAATMKFQQSGAQEDLDEWRRLAALYADAINLSKRQEERRNMFMPKGMSTMKTEVEGDQPASFAEGKGEKQEQLLGFKMAFMERVIAEMKIAEEEKKKKKEEEGDEITPELLGTLSTEEKKMLRKHLLKRLSDATEKRQG